MLITKTNENEKKNIFTFCVRSFLKTTKKKKYLLFESQELGDQLKTWLKLLLYRHIFLLLITNFVGIIFFNSFHLTLEKGTHGTHRNKRFLHSEI